MFKKILFAVFIIPFVFTGVVNAHGGEAPSEKKVAEKNISGILPGDFFYFLDIFSEKLDMLFTFGNTAKAEKYLSIADERLAEARELAREGKSAKAEKTTEKYQEQLEKALKEVKKAEREDKKEDVDEVLSVIAESTMKHQAVLADVYDKVSEDAKDNIEKAMENSMKGYEMALSAISKEKQDEMQDEIEQLLEGVDSDLKKLRDKGMEFPKMKMKHMDELDESLELDDLEDSLDNLDELDDLEDDLDEFEDLGIGDRSEKSDRNNDKKPRQ